MKKNKKPIFILIGIVTIALITLTSTILTTKSSVNDYIGNKETYIENVETIINDLNEKSETLGNINPNDKETLITTYEDIIAIANSSKYLTPPKELADFDFKFQLYMFNLKDSYQQIIDGTRDDDVFLIAKGTKELGSFDNSFILELDRLK